MRAVSRKAERHSVLRGMTITNLVLVTLYPYFLFGTAMVELIPLREAFAAVGGEGDPVSILFFMPGGEEEGNEGEPIQKRVPLLPSPRAYEEERMLRLGYLGNTGREK